MESHPSYCKLILCAGGKPHRKLARKKRKRKPEGSLGTTKQQSSLYMQDENFPLENERNQFSPESRAFLMRGISAGIKSVSLLEMAGKTLLTGMLGDSHGCVEKTLRRQTLRGSFSTLGTREIGTRWAAKFRTSGNRLGKVFVPSCGGGQRRSEPPISPKYEAITDLRANHNPQHERPL